MGIQCTQLAFKSLAFLSSLVYCLKQGSESEAVANAATDGNKVNEVAVFLAKCSFMVSIWSFVVFLGQSMVWASSPSTGQRFLQLSWRNTEFFLLSVLFSLKGYRFLFSTNAPSAKAEEAS